MSRDTPDRLRQAVTRTATAAHIGTAPGVDERLLSWRQAHHRAAVARSKADTARLFAEGAEDRWMEALVYGSELELEHARQAYERALGWYDRTLARVETLAAAELAARNAVLQC